MQEWIGRIQGVLFFWRRCRSSFCWCAEFSETWSRFGDVFLRVRAAGRGGQPRLHARCAFAQLAIAGIYFFVRWQEEERFKWLLVSAVLVSVALLIKLPMAVIGAPLLYLAVTRPRNKIEDGELETAAPWKNLLARWELWFFAAITLVPSALWYWHAHRIAEQFYPYHFFGGGGSGSWARPGIGKLRRKPFSRV